MKTEDRAELAAQAIVRRAEDRFQAHRMEIATWTDWFFARLMVGQWLFAIAIAVVISPYAWEGKAGTAIPRAARRTGRSLSREARAARPPSVPPPSAAG